MTESLMLVALGFVVAILIAVLLSILLAVIAIPIVWRRAMEMATNRAAAETEHRQPAHFTPPASGGNIAELEAAVAAKDEAIARRDEEIGRLLDSASSGGSAEEMEALKAEIAALSADKNLLQEELAEERHHRQNLQDRLRTLVRDAGVLVRALEGAATLAKQSDSDDDKLRGETVPEQVASTSSVSAAPEVHHRFAGVIRKEAHPKPAAAPASAAPPAANDTAPEAEERKLSERIRALQEGIRR